MGTSTRPALDAENQRCTPCPRAIVKLLAAALRAVLLYQDCEAIMAKVLERSGTVAHKSNTEGK